MIFKTAGNYNVDPAVFLDMTIVEMNMYVQGINESKNNEIELSMRIQDQLNYTLGQYIAIGINDPKNYPRAPHSSNKLPHKEEKREMTAEEMAISLKAWMGVLGGKEVTYGK